MGEMHLETLLNLNDTDLFVQNVCFTSGAGIMEKVRKNDRREMMTATGKLRLT